MASNKLHGLGIKGLKNFVFTLGFSHSRCDHSLFIYKNGHEIAYILLYIDDIIITASSDSLRQFFMRKLANEFAMKDLGELSYFLSISVHRTSQGLFLSQSKYAREIIDRADMSSCKPSHTPVESKSKLSSSVGAPYHDPTFYRSLASALQYLTFTRPGISYAVQQICLHMHDPHEAHMAVLKQNCVIYKVRYILVFIYPSAIRNTWFHIPMLIGPVVPIPCDLRQVIFGDNLISWSSKRQPTLSHIVSESCWMRNLLLELHCPIDKATLVYCENVSVIFLSSNPVQHQRTKHIELDIHFVREKVARGQVRVLHVPSRYRKADIFTKGLPRLLFEDFLVSLNVRDSPVSTAEVY
ncbi:uncharacterized mitochondrial protein AtMg00810-like [Rutidosis leptorrhynchoides]|uniref:uncharacterized mitochondrial protein AtMg00810-like n=1 Tax=Rutidosis leptorrhynchoides TaxID=125765 RepID=UPI003A993D83